MAWRNVCGAAAVLALLGLIATPVWASETAEATAEQPQAEPSPEVWDVHARALMNSGHLDAADAVLDARLAIEPGDVQARFLKGLIAMARGDNRRAIGLFRSILIDHPNATRVRLELARAFYNVKDYGNARRQFQFALAGKLPPEVTANINRYMASIRDAKSLSFTVGIAVAPDSNLNTGSSAREVTLFGLPFDLSDDARGRSGVGLAVEAGTEWAPRIGHGKRLRLGFNIQRREYAGSEFDDMTAAAYAGPRVVTGRWDLSVLGTAYMRWYGGRRYNSALGGRVEATYHLSNRLELSAALGMQSLRFQRTPARGGPLFFLNASGFYALSPSSGTTLKLGISRQNARAAGFSSWSGFVAAGYYKDLPMGFSAYVEPSLSVSRYDAALFGFDRPRADTTGSLLLTLLNRHLALGRFTPRISYTYTQQYSSVSLYVFSRHRVEIGLTTTF